MMVGRLLLVCALVGAGPSAWSAEFTVDAGQVGKQVYPLNGVNAGPGHMPHLTGQTFTQQYREMGIPLVRRHDYYGPGDLSDIFPVGWGADPSVDRLYRFAAADAVVREIEEAGCQVLFCLGESWYKDDPHNEIPSDFSTVAEVCRRIVAHYGGYEATPYRARIRLWEFWNEPNHEMFWDLDQDKDCEQFYSLYDRAAGVLADEFPSIRIGGPGAKGDTSEGIAEFAGRFARACRKRGSPLHFYSWHSYNRNREGPHVFAKQARMVREALNDAGFGKTVNVLDEWNTTSYRPEQDITTTEDRVWKAMLGNMDGAAFSAAALIYLHLRSDVRYACRYRGDYWVPEDGYGLINADGSLKKPGYAFKAYANLFPGRGARTMHLLDGRGGDQEGDARARTIMATTDEGRTMANVLISMWRCGREPLSLTVRNLPDDWQQPRMVHYLVSERHDWREVARGPLERRPGAPFVYRGGRIGGGRLVAPSAIHVLRLFDAAVRPAPPRMGGEPPV